MLLLSACDTVKVSVNPNRLASEIVKNKRYCMQGMQKVLTRNAKEDTTISGIKNFSTSSRSETTQRIIDARTQTRLLELNMEFLTGF